MGPGIDIYGLTRHRDAATIERFLAAYVDRAANEDRGDEELMMEPVGATEEPKDLDNWDWEPAGTLTRSIQRGLDCPRRAFTLYLKPSRPDSDRAILR